MDLTTNCSLNIANWNANSIRNKLHEFYDFLIDNQINIACLQETMLSPNDIHQSHPDFVLHRNDRIVEADQRQSGGVAILINRNIRHELLPSLNTKLLETIGIEIYVSNGSKIQIWSVYLPGGSNNNLIHEHYRNDLLKLINRSCSYFINGDFNSKHRLWNCCRANRAGNILHNLNMQHNFLVVHPSTPTHYPYASKSLPSTIDLLLTNGLHQTTDMETHTSNSNHQIITYSIDLNHQYSTNGQHKIPLFRSANWNKFQSVVNNKLSSYQLPNPDDITITSQIDTMLNDFTTAVMEGQLQSVPFIHPTLYAVTITPEIKSKIRLRNTIKRQAQRNPHLANDLRPAINRLSKEISSDINFIANSNFQHKLSTMNNDDNYPSGKRRSFSKIRIKIYLHCAVTIKCF